MLRFPLMLQGPRTPLSVHVLASVLIAAFFLQSFLASRIKSPTSDEPPHIAAGLSYVQKGNFVPNPQHPPLLKEMAAISLLLAGIRLPDTPTVSAMLKEPLGPQLEWGVGNDVITHDGPQKVMFWARLPLILLSTFLGLILYLWGRRILGDVGALGALFLFALDPNMIAHSQFVATDMGMTVFTTLFFFSLWSWLRKPGEARLVWSGFAMGLLLCAKFSAVLMLPVALVLMLAAALLRGGPEMQNMATRLFKVCWQFGAMAIVACLVIMAVYFSISGLSAYVYGFNNVYADADPNYLAYMAGELQHRFTSYFAVAWSLKEPLGTIALVILGSVTLTRDRRITILDKLFLFLPPVVLFIACTFRAENIGIRYLFPAFPFLYLAGGAGLALLIRNRSLASHALAAVLCIWIALAAAGIYPDHLSYFNEAACLLHDPAAIGWDGGARCGPFWLDDSNTDWGQGFEQLRMWRKAHPDPRPIRLLYTGSFPPEPYGLVPEFVPAALMKRVPSPGLYVISAKYVSRLTDSWLTKIPPTMIVGHALYVYDIPAAQP